MAEFLTGTTSTALVMIDSSDIFLVAGAARHVDFDKAIYEFGTNFSTLLRIDGTILCAGYDAIQMNSDGIATDRVIIGTQGEVHSIDNPGVTMNGGGSQVLNGGQISGATGVRLDGGLFALLDNTGTITGIGGSAVRLIGSNSVQITNAGSIRGDTGILLDNSYAQILNAGSIVATSGNGAAIDSVDGSGANLIRNTGRIEAQQIAIKGGTSTETVINSGDILGDVSLGGSDDVLRGRLGLILGDIYGGTGNDFIASGRGDDFVSGDDGNDTLRGGAGDDSLYGGKGLDVLRGDEGDDLLFGGNGRDTFVFNRHSDDDRVADFANGFDLIDVQAFHFISFATVSASATDRPGGLLIDLRSFGGGTVFLEGFLKASFDAGDVIL